VGISFEQRSNMGIGFASPLVRLRDGSARRDRAQGASCSRAVTELLGPRSTGAKWPKTAKPLRAHCSRQGASAVVSPYLGRLTRTTGLAIRSPYLSDRPTASTPVVEAPVRHYRVVLSSTVASASTLAHGGVVHLGLHVACNRLASSCSGLSPAVSSRRLSADPPSSSQGAS